MALKIHVNSYDIPIGALILVELVRNDKNIDIEVIMVEDKKNPGYLELKDKDGNVIATSENNVARFFARTIYPELYGGSNALERTEVDSWLSFAIGHMSGVELADATLNYLNSALALKTWLVAKHLTIADIRIFSALYDRQLILEDKYVHIARWFKQIEALPQVIKIIDMVSKKHNKENVSANKQNGRKNNNKLREKDKEGNKRKQEGKFIDLPGAENGKVVVRFPPEASGYLHIGHAKAALLNQYYADAFNGKLIMRFDDTNPAKENVEFEKAILEDLEMLQIKPNIFTHSSDHFEVMLSYCEKLLKDGKAFVDDTPAEIMKEQRDKKLPSENRDKSVEVNLALWSEMLKGSPKGQQCCVRAKIDYKSDNGCMRDPTIYRCKPEPHPRTGTTYKVYPTYDFACPIVDAIEGVTHTLRTTEYHDRDPQFYWFIEALGLNRPYIWEYSRLNMTHTVLSKRKLTWFVTEGLVDGWDDPRFPTVRGILRRGMTVTGLKEFIIAQGSSKSVVFMEWDKIWAINKKIIDPIATRYTAIENDIVLVNVENAKTEWLSVQNHQKDKSLGMKQVLVGPKVYIEREDADQLKENSNATFINWGNLLIKKIVRENGKITSINAATNFEDKDFKNTLKVSWVCSPKDVLSGEKDRQLIPCCMVFFDHIMSKAVLGKDDDFKDFVAKNTRQEKMMLGECELSRVKKGEIIQILRKGYFRCDVPFSPVSSFSSREQPLVLFNIPDGHTTTTATTTAEEKSKTKIEVPKESDSTKAYEVQENIIVQGNKIRELKQNKADKQTIQTEVKILQALKADFKAITGSDWTQSTVVPQPSASNDITQISEKITEQGNKVRELKQKKGDKAAIDAEVKTLLTLKSEFKSLTGSDWSPSVAAKAPSTNTTTSSDDASKVSEKITEQGNKVRELKQKKGDKAAIDAEVKTLLALKSEFKSLTGSDWSPSVAAKAPSTNTTTFSDDASKVSEKITEQGNKVRELKQKKVDKAAIDAEVKTLLALKSEFKSLTGSDWSPSVAANAPSTNTTTSSDGASKISEKVTEQGNKVRELKQKKVDKATIDTEVKTLLALKSEYKKLTGSDWSPSAATKKVTVQGNEVRELNQTEYKNLPDSDSKLRSVNNEKMAVEKISTSEIPNDVAELTDKIVQQGDKLRKLKQDKVEKVAIDTEVKTLLALKAEYKNLTGNDYVAANSASSRSSKSDKASGAEKKKDPKQKSGKTAKKEKIDASKKELDPTKTGTRLGLEAKKLENLSDWYSQVITKGEMIEYYDVSGCYILRPWSFTVWDIIKEFFDNEIKKLGVQNCYFPIFVSRAALEREKEHIADFAPEVAWVTKSGDSDLDEPIAIRPTSETVMYPAYAKWLKSHRDLPLKLNQWNNVVRWEFKHPQPFLRTREFLWQEGHTAFATKAEADEEVLQILDLYKQIYEDFLAIPVVPGRKTEKEKFAGGDYTTTVEAFISASGRGIQGATSHHLGQNFSRMFDIQVEGAVEGGEKIFVYQNSWGITTRTIGVMIMVHGDDKGLVIPPKVAAVQVIIVPCGITASTSQEQKDALMAECEKIEKELRVSGEVRVKGDYRDNYSPGWKFNRWELKGVPLRLELGPKDMAKNEITLVRRDNGQRITTARKDALKSINNLLIEIQKTLFNKAKADLDEHIKLVNSWDEFCVQLNQKNLLLAPFCGGNICEDNIKRDSAREDPQDPTAPSMGAKSLCIPFVQPEESTKLDTLKCIHTECKNKPQSFALFGRSY